MTTEKIRLTSFSKSSGCGCKLAPALLDEILKGTSFNQNNELLIGIESKDDAAVFSLSNTNCLILTNDFFTPVVDDPFHFGQIAAANSISDIYAMGGTPLVAVSILGFPSEKLEVNVATKILAGGIDICNKAGIPLAGGHTIEAPEPFFGLAVNGTANKKHIKRNNTAKPGNLLLLTKPLGTGIFSTAIKRQKLEPMDYAIFIHQATALNKVGQRLGKVKAVDAMTDVTGFGLLGHLAEMCEGSGTSAELFYNKLPLLPNLSKYTGMMMIPDNTYRNWNSVEKQVNGITPESFLTLNDPQTNGGLLISVDPAGLSEVERILKQYSNNTPIVIGEMKEKSDSLINVTHT